MANTRHLAIAGSDWKLQWKIYKSPATLTTAPSTGRHQWKAMFNRTQSWLRMAILNCDLLHGTVHYYAKFQADFWISENGIVVPQTWSKHILNIFKVPWNAQHLSEHAVAILMPICFMEGVSRVSLPYCFPNPNNFFNVTCRIKVLVCVWLYKSF